LVTYGNCYKIRLGGLDGTAGTGTLSIICEWYMCPWSDAPQPDPDVPDIGYGTKNRYLSFQGTNPGGQPEAMRVRFADLPPPFDTYNGQTMWVGEPFPVSEAAGNPNVLPPNFTAARLQCEPHFMDWSSLGVVHVLGPEIVPNATYDIQAIQPDCAATMCFDMGEDVFSLPLTVSTSRWGDLVGVAPIAGVWDPPQGVVDFVDLSALVDKFTNSPGAPSKTRTDLAYDTPDRKVDFVDISHAVGAFRGDPYPFAGPVGCP
jgi:hypothetical protein